MKVQCWRLLLCPWNWGYRFVTQTWLRDDAKEKLCSSNMTFISEQSTTAWQVVRWRRVETLISGLNPPGRSLSQFWCDSGPSGTLGLLYSFPSMPCAFLRAGVLGNKLKVPPYAIWYGVWWRIVIADDKMPPHMASFREI
jgi:hypothetical protein